MTIDFPSAVQPRTLSNLTGTQDEPLDERPPGRGSASEPHILYLAHDLNDAAIWRRHHMLTTAGGRITVAGFRRRAGTLRGPAIVLGSTEDGRLFRRVLTVGRAAPRLGKRLGGIAKPDVILARNLEMLALAMRARRLWPGPPVRVVYEVLDIHRMMLGDSLRARLLRSLERSLFRSVSLVLVSSPGFVRQYFAPHGFPTETMRLIENKVMGAVTQAPPVSVGPEDILTIGWFGILRCDWTLRTLDTLTRAAPGRLRIVARGIPALDKLPGFHAVIDANPDMTFGGSYVYPDDLAAIYGEVHIIWMVDRYDPGQNSDWLLPNRLYEGSLQGRVPLALEGTEIAAFLRRIGVGLVLPRPDEEAVRDLLSCVGPDDIGRLGAAMRQVPPSTWAASASDSQDLLADIVGDHESPYRRLKAAE